MRSGKEVRLVEPTVPEIAEESKGNIAIAQAAAVIASGYRMISLEGHLMYEQDTKGRYGTFRQYVPLGKKRFERIAYDVLGAVTTSRMRDVFNFVVGTAPDMSRSRHLILLGDWVWDSRKMEWAEDVEPSDVVWRSPFSPHGEGPVQFVMDLVRGDPDRYEDIMQSIAPILMDKKPDGTIWWVGDGANGKSSLMDALYRLFPDQLAGLTVKGIADGRDTPMLNMRLANIVKESSEGHIEDSQSYKSIGTHEDFLTHTFHSQEPTVINGNMHHIFSANRIPTFGDKGHAVSRRTLIIPFKEKFDNPNPNFNDETFTEETLRHLLAEIQRVAINLSKTLKYDFSPETLAAKLVYDAESNSAADFFRYLYKEEGVIAFRGYDNARQKYQQWCGQNGYTPLGDVNFRKAGESYGYSKRSVRRNGSVVNLYVIAGKTASESHAVELGMSNPGLFRDSEWMPQVAKSEFQEEKAIEPKKEKKNLIDPGEGW